MADVKDRRKKPVKVSKEKRDMRVTVCKMCGTHRALIRKYNLYICRRCFKENAKDLGFKKLD